MSARTAILLDPDPGTGTKVQQICRAGHVDPRLAGRVIELRHLDPAPGHRSSAMTRCTSCRQVAIHDDRIDLEGMIWTDPDHFARIEGFASFAALRDHYRQQFGLPFKGVCLRWGLVSPADDTSPPDPR